MNQLLTELDLLGFSINPEKHLKHDLKIWERPKDLTQLKTEYDFEEMHLDVFICGDNENIILRYECSEDELIDWKYSDRVVSVSDNDYFGVGCKDISIDEFLESGGELDYTPEDVYEYAIEHLNESKTIIE